MIIRIPDCGNRELVVLWGGPVGQRVVHRLRWRANAIQASLILARPGARSPAAEPAAWWQEHF